MSYQFFIIIKSIYQYQKLKIPFHYIWNQIELKTQRWIWKKQQQTILYTEMSPLLFLFFFNEWLSIFLTFHILCLFDNYFHDLFLITFLSLPHDFHWSLYNIISHVYFVKFDALYVNINWNLYFWCQAFANQSLT